MQRNIQHKTKENDKTLRKMQHKQLQFHACSLIAEILSVIMLKKHMVNVNIALRRFLHNHGNIVKE